MKLANKGFLAIRRASTGLLISFITILLLQLNGCGGGGSTAPVTERPEASDSFSGVAQKGPFSSGSEVRIEQLSEQGNPTENIIYTQTTGAAANFDVTIPDSWQANNQLPVQVTVKGSFLDESYTHLNANPNSEQQITLNALLEEPANTSINLLTHWASLRAKFLMFRENKNISVALQQATDELQTYSGIAHISELDLSQSEVNSSDNLQLLLLSGALQDVAKSYHQSSQTVINQIAVDFAEDGIINHQGRVWFKRIQANLRHNSENKIKQYANVLSKHFGKTITTDALPEAVNIADRPQALVPQIITAETGKIVILDGSSSLSTNGGTLQYTWVRLDQHTQFDVSISDRFIATPSITTPQQEVDLLFALFVRDNQQIADTTIVKVKVRFPQPANQQPTADSQFIETNEDEPTSFTLSGTDPDGDDLTINLPGELPILLNHGTLERTQTQDGTTSSLTYTPEANFSGTDYFDFTVSDATTTSASARVGITINQVNDQPVVAPGQTAMLDEDTTATITLTGWFDVDNDGSDLTLDAITDDVDHGVLTVISSSEVQYTPNNHFFGSDSFSYQITDGNAISQEATVTISVVSVNDNPNAYLPASEVSVDQHQSVDITLRGDDPEEDPITYVLVSPPSKGDLFIDGSNPIENIGDLPGTPPNLSYRPYTLSVGADSFTYRVRDNGGLLSSDVTVPITIVAVNIQPIADPKTSTTHSNTAVDIELTGSDGDGDTFIFVNRTEPSNGTVSGTPPYLTYTPNNNYIGTDLFTYQVRDEPTNTADPATSNVAIVNIDVINQAPTAKAGSDLIVTSGDTVTLYGQGSSDPEDQIESYQWTAPTGVTFIGTGNVVNPTFTAPSSGSYEFTLLVTDNYGATSSDTVTVTVNPPNQPPIVNVSADQVVVTAGNTVQLTGFASDAENDVISYVWNASPNAGAFDNANTANPQFTTPTGITSQTTYTLTLTVTAAGATATDNVVITVNPPNQAPTANAGEDLPMVSNSTIILNGSGTDIEDDNATLSYSWDVTSVAGALDHYNAAQPIFTAIPVTSSTPYDFTLTVTDSAGATATDTVTITVEPADASDLFTLKVQATDSSFTIPTIGSGYDFFIDCDDSNGFTHVTDSSLPFSCNNYSDEGIHHINIMGDFPRLDFYNGAGNVDSNRNKLLSIENWGKIEWDTMKNAFSSCNNLVVTASDTPDLSNVDNMSAMFGGASSFNTDISHWDVSNVKNMSALFSGATLFNQDISSWDVSSVEDMSMMFANTKAFNQDLLWGEDVSSVTNMHKMFYNTRDFNGNISGWNVSSVTNMDWMFGLARGFNNDLNWGEKVKNVTNMHKMFYYAKAFNGDISDWNVSHVTDMSHMFDTAEVFNRDIGNWVVSSVNNMTGMFNEAEVFNQDISNWIVSSVTDMKYMFRRASMFNQNLNWDVSNVTNMQAMFDGTSVFTGDISNWDVSKVTDMYKMFFYANAFNQDISNWDVSSVKKMGFMFFHASIFNADISGWDVSKVEDMSAMFALAEAFNQDIGGWNVSKVTNMHDMFNAAHLFNQDLSTWDVSSVWNMENMFQQADAFNEKLDWDLRVGNVTNMEEMFHSATAFNQDIDGWDVSSVTNMRQMFYDATAFNQPLNSWDVSKVETMNGMFKDAILFNQPLNSWDVSSVGTNSSGQGMNSMFYRAAAFNGDIRDWSVSNVTDMSAMFYQASSFNNNISQWDVGSLKSANSMFNGAVSFDQDLGNWNVINIGTSGGSFGMDAMFHQVTLSTPNYDSLLIGWSNKIQRDVGFTYFNAGENSRYSPASETARQAFVDQFTGEFVDGGPVPTVTIATTSGQSEVASGNTIELITSTTNLGTNVTYQWEVSPVPPNGGFSDTTTANPDFTTPTGITSPTPYTLTLTVTDAGDTITDSLNITVNPPNQAPSANTNTVSLVSNTFVTMVLTGSDPDGDDASLTYSIATNPSHGIVSGTAPSITYTPSTNFSGTDTFTFIVNDGTDNSAEATITVTVSNQAPTANANAATLTSNSFVNMLLTGSDPDGDDASLTYSIATNPSHGTVSGTAPTITYTPNPNFSGMDTFTFIVNDGTDDSVEATITITVDPIDTSNPFKMKVQAANDSFILPTRGIGYNFLIDCGNGNGFTHVNDSDLSSAPMTCIYTDSNPHTIQIAGQFPRLNFKEGEGNDQGNRNKLIEIEQWGNIQWDTMQGALYGCEGLLTVPNSPAPNLTNVTDMEHMFAYATSFNQDLNQWNVGNVEKMYGMFMGASAFNGIINGWDVSKVTSMGGMFNNAESFTRDLNGWIVSSVEDMNSMFAGATVFNGNIQNWDVQNVVQMWGMFKYAEAFDQNLTWDVSKVTKMQNMFDGAIAFTGLGSNLLDWDVSKVTDMSSMFNNAKSFAGDVSQWEVGNVTNMYGLFTNALLFNSDLKDWNVHNVLTMERMLHGTAFNKDISDWNVSSVTNMRNMFSQNTVFNQDINDWDVNNVTTMQNMFYGTENFNKPLDDWDVGKVENMHAMFMWADDFDQDLSSWDISSVTLMSDMFLGITLSTSNYDSLLLGWSNKLNSNSLSFHAGNSTYSPSAATARAIFSTHFTIDFEDGGAQ